MGSVRRAEPKRAADVMFDFKLAPGRSMGAQMIVELGPQRETRGQRGGAIGGRKNIAYMVLLNIFHRSMAPHSEDATDDMDLLVEAIYDLIRTDKTFNNTVVSSGETHYGIRTSPPAIDINDQRVLTYVAVSFESEVEIVA